ncbi:MAG: energy transducer TonB [Balneolaceae bacterium]
MNEYKKPSADLKRSYTIYLQTGIIFSLLIIIALFKIDFRGGEPVELAAYEQEIIEIEDIIQTEHQEEIPPPERPPVPIEVPDDEFIEDYDLNLDADLSFGDHLAIPPPPDLEEEPDEGFFEVVEHEPELIDGYDGLYKRISYPDRARISGIEGTVIVRFIVNTSGDVEQAEILRSVGAGCDEEALRAIRESKFRPGLQRGRPVPVRMSMPIRFVLQN